MLRCPPIASRSGRRASVTVVSVVLSSIACTTTLISQTPSPVDSAAIGRQFSRFQNALLARDTLSIEDSNSGDAVSLLQNQPVRRGRNSIVQRWKKVLASPLVFRIVSEEISVSSSGRDAFQFGRFAVHSADTTNTLLASGKILFIWKRQPDRWRIALEMDNFNATTPQKSTK